MEPIPLTLEDLDHLMDTVGLDALEGYPVDWNGAPTRIVRLGNGGHGLPLTLTCEVCGVANPDLVYAISGLHSGAWCYVTDCDGKYLANLRDQSWFCDACAAKRSADHPEEAVTPPAPRPLPEIIADVQHSQTADPCGHDVLLMDDAAVLVARIGELEEAARREGESMPEPSEMTIEAWFMQQPAEFRRRLDAVADAEYDLLRAEPRAAIRSRLLRKAYTMGYPGAKTCWDATALSAGPEETR